MDQSLHWQILTVTEILHKQLTQSDSEKSPQAPTAPVLRVPANTTATPALRVPQTTATTAFQRVKNTPAPAIITQEEATPEIPAQTTVTPPAEPEITDSPSDEMYTFDKVLNHKAAPKGCGSKYQVEVQWDQHPPSYVPVNIFTEHGHNTEAWNAVKDYVHQNHLHNISGFKQFSQANLLLHKKDTAVQINKAGREFFQHCYLLQQQANKAINPDTGKLSEYSTLLKSSDGKHWEESCCQEIGRLAAGYPPEVPTGTETIHFIRFDQIPAGRKATYLRLVVADRPMKANPRRVRFTVGGDKIEYPYDVSTKIADLTTAKILINSTISTPGAKFMCADIKDFYLNNPMKRYEYMRIPTQQIPKKIMDLYNLHSLVHNGAVYVEIRKGMYGLPQAAKIASDALIPVLEKAGYHQSQHTPGLFKHETRPISFCLVVDDFGIKYVGKEHADHLLDTLRQAKYQLTVDWEGKQFCGITLDWDYENGTVDLSMPGYVEKALQRFAHPKPTTPEYSPYEWTQPNYGAKQQLTSEPDNSQPLDATGIKRLQAVIGTLLYYGRAIDNTMLVALGSLASQQTKGTEATAKALNKLLNYAASNPDATIRFTSSGMILHIHSDASYLSETEARSRAGGFFFLSDQYNPSDKTAPPPKLNGAIHIVCQILSNVMASATEAEVGALFHNAQDACQLRNTLEFLGHPQPPTPIQTDNSCAEGIVNNTVKQKRSKAIDMRFYWVRDRVQQGQFEIFWRKGEDNYGDYFTKHHSAAHHRAMRPIYLYEHNQALSLISFQ